LFFAPEFGPLVMLKGSASACGVMVLAVIDS